MFGAQILARSLSVAVRTGRTGVRWQYHSRTNRHSKIACWGMVFDLIRLCPVLRQQIAEGKIGFALDSELCGNQGRRKKLDFVLCTRGEGRTPGPAVTFMQLAGHLQIVVSSEERAALAAIPELYETSVGDLRLALQSKACMTSHGVAGRRLFDELDSWQTTVCAMQPKALRAGVVIINSAANFRSPVGQTVVRHKQPQATHRAIAAIQRVPRCDSNRKDGFDALGVVIVDCANDGHSPIRWIQESPAPQRGEAIEYETMIRQLAEAYAAADSQGEN
jgi:hypothetical protein